MGRDLNFRKVFNRMENPEVYRELDKLEKNLETGHIDKYLVETDDPFLHVTTSRKRYKSQNVNLGHEDNVTIIIGDGALNHYSTKELGAFVGLKILKQQNKLNQTDLEKYSNSFGASISQTFMTMAGFNSLAQGRPQMASAMFTANFALAGFREWGRDTFATRVVEQFGEKIGDFKTLTSALEKSEVAESQMSKGLYEKVNNFLKNNSVSRFLDRTMGYGISDQETQINKRILNKSSSYADSVVSSRESTDELVR